MSGFKLALAALALVAPVTALSAGGQDSAANQAAAAIRFTLDTPIEQLVADTRARAVLDARLPGLTGHASYNSFKQFSLRQLQPFSQGMISDAALRLIETDLAAIR